MYLSDPNISNQRVQIERALTVISPGMCCNGDKRVCPGFIPRTNLFVVRPSKCIRLRTKLKRMFWITSLLEVSVG